MRTIILKIFVLCFISGTLLAQNAILTGTVLDKEGHIIRFATVNLKGSQFSAVSNEQGSYRIENIPPGIYTLEFKSLIYESAIQNISLKANEVLQVNLTCTKKPTRLPEVEIIASRSINGIAHLDDISNNIIFAGKKNEVLILDSLNANTAQNNPRQVLGRIPGINFSETEGSGFPANGIGFRGLNPSQSVETNTRQNGYNIAADIYGYPEAYYVPPLEAVERIEVVRGASSLQFGPQFGGLVNYVVKKGEKDKPLHFNTQQTLGSFNMFNSFNSLGGTYKKFNYYSFANYKHTDGWRDNSPFSMFSGFAGVNYQANDKLNFGLEYSILRNRIQMPGGLNDVQFQQNPRKSYRNRNWLNSPWNILSASMDYKFNENNSLNVKSTFLNSQRNLVWRNEDGGPGSIDSISPITGYVPREVQKESFKNWTTEIRMLHTYSLFGQTHAMASGLRFFSGSMSRKGGGPGSTNSDFDLNLYGGDYEYNLNFTTTNLALFAENIFRITSKFSVTPGIRYEYIRSTVQGYVTDSAGALHTNDAKTRNLPLAGLGFQYKTTETTSFYANISQAYRPIDYSAITPLGVAAKIDPNMKDASGYNADFGWRGTVKKFLNVDLGAFYLTYNKRVGITTATGTDGKSYIFVTNVANSVHKGLESYLEFDPVKLLVKNSRFGTISFFNSLSYIDARYTSGDYTGKYVEYAPVTINRFGSTYTFQTFSMTFLVSNTSQSFGDANNTAHDENAIVGLIPAFQVMDFSARLRFKERFTIKSGCNNLANKMYFTKRTDEYPGPGIIPAIGRSFYISLAVKF